MSRKQPRRGVIRAERIISAGSSARYFKLTLVCGHTVNRPEKGRQEEVNTRIYCRECFNRGNF